MGCSATGGGGVILLTALQLQQTVIYVTESQYMTDLM
jgi:hypothetical protein